MDGSDGCGRAVWLASMTAAPSSVSFCVSPMTSDSPKPPRFAVSISETLVVVAVISTLWAFLLPAVNAAREIPRPGIRDAQPWSCFRWRLANRRGENQDRPIRRQRPKSAADGPRAGSLAETRGRESPNRKTSEESRETGASRNAAKRAQSRARKAPNATPKRREAHQDEGCGMRKW